MNKKRQLICCCCGADAGYFEQHWNRDAGYGLCAKCVEFCAKGMTADQFKSNYGVAGVNYPATEESNHEQK